MRLAAVIMAVPQQVICAGLCTHTHTRSRGGGQDTHPALPSGSSGGGEGPRLQEEGGRETAFSTLPSIISWCLPQQLREEWVLSCAARLLGLAWPAPPLQGSLGAISHKSSMCRQWWGEIQPRPKAQSTIHRVALALHRAQGAHTECACG